ncbi:MAG: hypothetical protein AB7O64_00010 [Methylibium sp.]
MKFLLSIAVVTALSVAPSLALPQSHDPGTHQHGQAQANPPDHRQAVRFPEPLRSHTLANMRDHLLALGEIQEALSRADFDRASDIAEERLGMSSLQTHGAHDVAKFMPKAMQDAGTAMHRSASQFATVAKDASVTGDLKPALAALARVNQTCVACHAGFRMQ